jgi:hypothetical protein
MPSTTNLVWAVIGALFAMFALPFIMGMIRKPA